MAEVAWTFWLAPKLEGEAIQRNEKVFHPSDFSKAAHFQLIEFPLH
jgi:hypothetical protein